MGSSSNKQVRFLQQQFRQRQAHLPAAGEFFGLPLPVFFLKAQTHEYPPDFGFNRVAVAGAEFVLEAVITVGHSGVFRAGGVEFGELVQQRFEFLLPCLRRSSKTDMHSANTVRPESDKPSWGRYPAVVPLAMMSEP